MPEEPIFWTYSYNKLKIQNYLRILIIIIFKNPKNIILYNTDV